MNSARITIHPILFHVLIGMRRTFFSIQLLILLTCASVQANAAVSTNPLWYDIPGNIKHHWQCLPITTGKDVVQHIDFSAIDKAPLEGDDSFALEFAVELTPGQSEPQEILTVNESGSGLWPNLKIAYEDGSIVIERFTLSGASYKYPLGDKLVEFVYGEMASSFSMTIYISNNFMWFDVTPLTASGGGITERARSTSVFFGIYTASFLDRNTSYTVDINSHGEFDWSCVQLSTYKYAVLQDHIDRCYSSPEANCVKLQDFSGGDRGEGLDLDGDFSYAVNIRGSGEFSIRDADFMDDAATGVSIGASHERLEFNDAEHGSSANDDNLETIMESIRYSLFPNQMTAGLAVTPGQEYKLQLLFMEGCCNRAFDVTIEDELALEALNVADVHGPNEITSNGVVMSYTFLATDNNVNIALGGTDTAAPDDNPILSGLTLERLASVSTFSGGDQSEGLDLEGDFAYAVNVNGAGGFSVRDADFTDDAVAGVYVWGPNSTSNWANPEYGSSSNDNNLESIMRTIRWFGFPGHVLTDLAVTPGQQYKLQLLFVENSSDRAFDIEIEGKLVLDDLNVGVVQGLENTAKGVVLTYELFASDDTLNIALGGANSVAPDRSSMLSGFTLERIGPVMHLPFEAEAGAVAEDTSGSDNDGMLAGGVSWDPNGRKGSALAFDGLTGKVALGTGPALSGQTNFTLAAWIKTSATSRQFIMQQRDSSIDGEYWFEVTADGALGFVAYDLNARFQFEGMVTTATVNDGTWHHVAVVRQGLSARIYIDGVEQAAATSTEMVELNADLDVAIGADIRDNNKYFNGLIDEARIYDTALSETAIGVLAQ